jgi:hypothetical protein
MIQADQVLEVGNIDVSIDNSSIVYHSCCVKMHMVQRRSGYFN